MLEITIMQKCYWTFHRTLLENIFWKVKKSFLEGFEHW